MPRVRMEGTALKSWDEVNLNLKEIAECELKLEAIEADMNTKIQDLKLAAEMEAKQYHDRIAKLAQEIKEYTETHRDEIKGKTKSLNFGFVGFRQSTKIIIRNVQAVITALKARGMTDCIQVKETVLKDKLKDYPDDIIVAVGAGKKVEDTFWYETDREKLKTA